MSTYDYASKVDTVVRLLTKYGQSIQVINSGKTVLSIGQAVRGEMTGDNVPNTLTANIDAIYYLEPSMSGVIQSNFLFVNNNIYKIVKVEPIQPAETLMLYKVYVSS